MQLSQRSDDSPEDKDDQDREHPLLVNESPVSPVVHSSRTVSGTQEATATTSLSSVPAPPRIFPDLLVSHKIQTTTKTTTTISNGKLADVTPRSRAPRQPSAFVPATPSQNKILRKDVFGSGDTGLSELSDDSEADSMKALSRKLAARTDSMTAITKRASIIADTVSSNGTSGKKIAKRRVLDSDDEEVLSSSRKGAKGGSKSGAGNAKKVLTVVVSDLGDDTLPAPAPLKKGRPKSTKKNPELLDEKPKPLVRDKNTKRKREESDGDDKVGGVADVRERPPPVKRARRTAGGKPSTTKVEPLSHIPPTPPRDSQVLRKVRPAAKKNANYSRRAKAARISSPTRDSVDPLVEPLLMDDGGGDYASSPPARKPKPKSKTATKPKSTLAENTALVPVFLLQRL
ncbi:hypothetical protein BDM02DRAFT_3115467, partial [Thelephora ganbajun]